MEGRIGRDELATSARTRGIVTFGQLIDLHVAGADLGDRYKQRLTRLISAVVRHVAGEHCLGVLDARCERADS